jgi:chromosome segregation ATPase
LIDNLLLNGEKLKGEQQDLQDNINSLSDYLSQLKTDKDGLDDAFKTIEEDYKVRTLSYESKLRSLEVQCNAQAYEIVEENASNNKIRDNLANMKKALDERDMNLRIREQKVSQSESTILRNSNLLNL